MVLGVWGSYNGVSVLLLISGEELKDFRSWYEATNNCLWHVHEPPEDQKHIHHTCTDWAFTTLVYALCCCCGAFSGKDLWSRADDFRTTTQLLHSFAPWLTWSCRGRMRPVTPVPVSDSPERANHTPSCISMVTLPIRRGTSAAPRVNVAPAL